MKIILNSILLLSFSLNTLACPETFEQLALRDHDAMSLKNSNKQRYLSQKKWNEILDEIQQIYNYHLSPAGIELRIDRFWNDPRINGTVARKGSLWGVLIYGGYTLSPHVTEDVIARVACHEIGHHLGGTAFYPGAYSWAAGEGQSDYYATLKCLRKYFQEKDNARALAQIRVPGIVKEQCQAVWTDRKDQLICMRSSMAAKAWTMVMYQNDNYSFDTPDMRVVAATNISHPNPQCRLDTHFQGALCAEDHALDTSVDDHRVGTCNADQYQVGLRPRCWYRPPTL